MCACVGCFCTVHVFMEASRRGCVDTEINPPRSVSFTHPHPQPLPDFRPCRFRVILVIGIWPYMISGCARCMPVCMCVCVWSCGICMCGHVVKVQTSLPFPLPCVRQCVYVCVAVCLFLVGRVDVGNVPPPFLTPLFNADGGWLCLRVCDSLCV